MKYFRVEEEYVSAPMRRVEISSNGEQIAEPYEADDIVCITVGYNVFVEGEDGRTEYVKFYPVKIDTEDFSDNSAQVLEQLKRDYPAPDWQNNSW